MHLIFDCQAGVVKPIMDVRVVLAPTANVCSFIDFRTKCDGEKERHCTAAAAKQTERRFLNTRSAPNEARTSPVARQR